MSLIQKLEAATQGSRELDAEIHRIKTGSKHRPIVLEHYPPHYTTSIDAALTLVPRGMHWRCDGPPRFYTLVGRPTPAGGFSMQKRYGKFVSYQAPSAALALCIAALKAREAA